MSAQGNEISRRSLLGGAIVIGFSLTRAARAQNSGNEKIPQNRDVKPQPFKNLPGSLKTAPHIDSWIRISADGITIVTGKVELGQGLKTAILQVACAELAVDIDKVKLQTADTALTPNEGYTAGSVSMQDSATAVRNAAAQAREILQAAAARQWGIDGAGLVARNGEVVAGDGRKLAYTQIADQTLLNVVAQPKSHFMERGKNSLIGKPVQRVDIPAKLTGKVAYVQDLRPEGMLHARVLRPPAYGARLAALNTGEAEQIKGVLKIVRNGSFVAVVAEREEQAIRALASLTRNSKWSGETKLPRREDLANWLRQLPAQERVIAGDRSAQPQAQPTQQPASQQQLSPPQSQPQQPAGKQFEAEFLRPFQMHGSIGPSCAVAKFENGVWTIWTHSQGVYPLRNSLAAMLRVNPESVHCIHVEGSGCYGHNGADDAAADAALIAQQMPGRPVRVQWMREQEHGWEPFGSAMTSRVRASLDESGKIIDWEYHVWSGTHLARPNGDGGNLLASWYLENPFELPIPKPLPQPAGGGDRNAIPLYKIPSQRVVHHFIPRMPVRVSALRALGAYMNVFSIESFMDELAAAAGVDPVEFRLRHLDDPRARDVINLVAAKFGWKSGLAKESGDGKGFAFARYKNHAAYTAVAVDLSVDFNSGKVLVKKIVAADDSGEIINPDGIRNQIQGGIVQSMSWTLHEEVALSETGIESRDWSTYPILRIADLPESLEVHLIDRPGEPFLGTGEAAQGPTAAAIGNAIFHATGKRLRELPLTQGKMQEALRA